MGQPGARQAGRLVEVQPLELGQVLEGLGELVLALGGLETLLLGLGLEFVEPASQGRLQAGELRRGQKLSNALAQSSRIPPFLLRMLAVGEETGDVDVMLGRIADRYEEDLRRSVKRLLALFEPIVIIILGIIVGSIVLLMFLAMMDLQNVA